MPSFSRKKCMHQGCEQPPLHDCIWADGRGRAWFCGTHWSSWNNGHREVIRHTKVETGEVPEKFTMRPPKKTARNEIVERILLAKEMAEEDESSSKSGVSGKFLEFLKDMEAQGVRVKNPDTGKEVKVKSLGKRPSGKKLLQKLFQDWLDKNEKTEEGGEKAPKKEAPKKEKVKKEPEPKEEPKKESEEPQDDSEEKEEPKGGWGVDQAAIDEILSKHGEDFDQFITQGKQMTSYYESKMKFSDEAKKPRGKFRLQAFRDLSPEEKAVHTIGSEIGKLFMNSLSSDEQERFTEIVDQWRDHPANANTNKIHGLLASMGVAGGPAPHDKNPKEAREEGTKDEELKQLLEKSYNFTQAFFQRIGLKEMTMFRGVKNDALGKEPPSAGDPVQIESRELTSWTTDPGVAFDFGRPVEYKVPVDRVLFSYLTFPGIGSDADKSSWGEAEMAIMGASDLQGSIRLNPGQEGMGTQFAAKSKVWKIQFGTEDDNWLGPKRKGPKPKHVDLSKAPKDKPKDKKARRLALADRIMHRWLQGKTRVS